MSTRINIVATLTPAAGKAGRVEELLKAQGEYVLRNEPNTLRYNITREVNTKGEPQFIIIETYTGQEALKTHGSAEPFKNFGRALKKEGLLAKPLAVSFVTPVAGFDLRGGSKL